MSLEQQAFGPMTKAAMACAGRAPAPSRLLPLGATVVLIALVAWSITKGIEYQDVFAGNPRYRMVLIAVNAAAIAAGMFLVTYHHHQPPRACDGR